MLISMSCHGNRYRQRFLLLLLLRILCMCFAYLNEFSVSSHKFAKEKKNTKQSRIKIIEVNLNNIY